MASSNRHWPSMFKSKPCNPWQHDINSSIISTSCHRTPYSSSSGGGGCEERSPEPKPRWNPKPEQIRILEAIFNSGMVNPPRDEIRKIRAQLQEYGQVGDANVFYWFQNRKSRSKHKLRTNLKNNNNINNGIPQTQNNINNITTPPSSSSSSSDKSPTSNNKELLLPTNKAFSIDVGPNSPTASVNQTYFQNETTPPAPVVVQQPHHDHDHHHHHQGFFFPVHHSAISQGFCFSELSNMLQPHQHHNNNTNVNVGPSTSLLLSEMMNHNHNQHHAGVTNKDQEAAQKAMKIPHQHQHQHQRFSVTSPSNNNNSTSSTCVSPHTNNTLVVPSTTTTTTTNVTVPSPMAQIQGGGAAKCTVFINDVAFEVGVGPFNVREAFGDDVVLVHASGHPVLTNDWGITLHSLHHGAFYYLIWCTPLFLQLLLSLFLLHIYSYHSSFYYAWCCHFSDIATKKKEIHPWSLI